MGWQARGGRMASGMSSMRRARGIDALSSGQLSCSACARSFGRRTNAHEFIRKAVQVRVSHQFQEACVRDTAPRPYSRPTAG